MMQDVNVLLGDNDAAVTSGQKLADITKHQTTESNSGFSYCQQENLFS